MNDQSLPLLPAQAAIWASNRVHAQVDFTVSHLLEIDGAVSAGRLSAALTAETAALRVGTARYVLMGDTVVMEIDDAASATVPELTADDVVADVVDWVEDYLADTAHVSASTPRFSAVITLPDGRSLIYCRGHHLSYDGYSAVALMHLMTQIYARGDDMPVPALDLAPALQAERDYRHSADHLADGRYWAREMRSVRTQVSLSGRYGSTAGRATILDERISTDLATLLTSVAQAQSTSIASLLTAAIVGFFARTTGVDDQVANFPVTARVTPAQLTSPIPHSNLVPLRVVVQSGLDAAGLLAATRTKVRAALDHQRYRYEDIIAELGPREKRTLEGPRGLNAPQINLMLFDSAMEFDGCSTTYNVLGIGPIDDVAVLCYYDGPHKDITTLRLGLRANPERYTDTEVDALHRRLSMWLGTFLTELARGSVQDVHELPLLTHDEEARLTGIVGPVLHTPTGEYEAEAASPELGVALGGSRCIVVAERGGLRAPGLVGKLLVAPAGEPFMITGRRARWLPETVESDRPALEYAGRIDDVIDLGDISVDLHALDDLVARHPHVAASASTWSSGQLVIHAALHPKAPSDIRQQLTDHLIRALPKAVRPHRIELLDDSYAGVVTALRISRRGPLEIAVRGGGLLVPDVDLSAATLRQSAGFAEVVAPVDVDASGWAAVGGSLLSAVHAALAGYVAYTTGVRDVVVGSPDPASSNRSLPTEALAAHSDVPLALRSQVDAEMSLREALRSVVIADGAVFDEARRRAEGDFDVVDVHLSAVARPTYDLNVVDLDVADGISDAHGLSFEVGAGTLTLRYPSLSMTEERAREILSAVVGLVEATLTNPDQTIGQVLAGAAPEPASAPESATLGEILETALTTHSDAIALEDLSATPPVRLTYAELAVAAGEVARELRARGVGPEDVVALHLGRSAYSVICTIACAWVGAAFVQLNPDDPRERKIDTVGRSGAQVVLSLAERVLGPTVEEIIVRREWAIPHWISFNSPPTREPFAQAPVDACAYLTFTSGTTGQPKGVAVTHRGILPWTRSVVDAAHVTAESRVLHNYSVVFDAHLIEVIPTLISGATIVMCPPDIIGGNELRALLAAQRITTFYSTPSVLATVDHPGGPHDDLPSLETVVVGGEPLSPAVATPWAASRRLINFYGPTETTVAVTGDVLVDASKPISIGAPLAGVTAYVLDGHLRPMPPNAIGELYIGGPSVARGYVGLPAQTAGRFVANPFAVGERLYRTGDRVHRDSSGRLIIHGRADEQIKLHGVRIEPAEINAALLKVPGVRDAYTALGPDHAGENVLVSWIVTDSVVASGAISGDAVRSRLRDHLPRTYLPTAVVPVDAFPLTANGKVDHRALPDWRAASLGGIPTNELEEIILQHFRSALGNDNIGVRDNFFTLGGDSLRAVEAAGAIERDIGRLVPVRLFFDYSTARALAGVLEEESTYNSAVATMVPSDADGDERPMAPFQQRFWFLHSAFPTSPAYLVPMFLPTPPDATRGQVAEAFNALVVRHEPLRTIYGNGPTGPIQQVLAEHVLDLPVIDAHDVDAVTAHLTTPFDLSTEPPVRVAFIEGSGGVGRGVFLVVHHLIVDRESVIILQQELVALLRSQSLPELGYTYADTARWHIDLLHGLRPELLDFWERQLRGFGAMELSRTPIEDPAQRPPIITVDKVYHHGLTLTHEQHVGISDVARRLGVTEFHVIHAALALALAAQGNTDDVLVVAPTTLRHRLRGGDLVGAFITGVLLRTTLIPELDADDFVRSVKNNDVICFDNALIPVEEIGMRIDFAKLIPGHLPVQVGLTYDTVDDLYPLVTDDEPSAALSELELHVTAARSASETQLVFGCADPLVRSEDGWMLIRRFETALDMLLAGGVIDYGRLRLPTDTVVVGGPDDRFAGLIGDVRVE